MTAAMAAGAAFLLAALVVSVGAGLLLYALVRAEHDRREVLDRDEGERLARRDTADEERSERTAGEGPRRG